VRPSFRFFSTSIQYQLFSQKTKNQKRQDKAEDGANAPFSALPSAIGSLSTLMPSMTTSIEDSEKRVMRNSPLVHPEHPHL